MITTLFVSVISGIFTSFSFYSFLRLLKPNIKISPKIARDRKEGIVKIKVINLAKRDALDIRAELVLLVPKNVPNGIIYVRKPIELKKNYLMNLSKYSKKIIMQIMLLDSELMIVLLMIGIIMVNILFLS